MGSRYSKVSGDKAREIVLLKGFPCSYGKCKFCNYIEDNSRDEDAINSINLEVLDEVDGSLGVLEVINSGSVFELPRKTIEKIREVVEDRGIRVLYFEAYYGYIKRLEEIREIFRGIEIRFRIGLETFDNEYRKKGLGKNFTLNKDQYELLGREYFSACLLVCMKGQTKEMIARDIELGLKYFRSITVNVFIDNGTSVKRDEELVNWFIKNYSYLRDDSQVEMLIDNKDLGVFEQ